MSENYRIENAQEELRKILHTDLGKETHEYLDLPGEYAGPEPCKKPDIDRDLPPAYLNYYVIGDDGKTYINSINYEDLKVDEDTISKNYRLSINFSCPYSKIPNDIIITGLPLSECTRRCDRGSIIIYPIIRSFANYDSAEHLENIKEKISNGEYFENVDALDILFVMKNCKTDHEKVLRDLCESFSQMKIMDCAFRENLKKAMRFVIHQYCESIDEIKELEKIIDYAS
jgi:hypothetical protein